MSRQDYVGTWNLTFMRLKDGSLGSDGSIEIGADASGNDDWHYNPDSGKPDHQLEVRFPSSRITFHEKGQDPGDPLYRYGGQKIPGVPSIAPVKLIKVKKTKKKVEADGDDSTWVATSGPGPLVDGEDKPARKRRASANKKKSPAGKKGSKKRR
jgi:ribosomal protein L34E